MLDFQLADQFNQVISVAKPTGVSTFGDPIYGAPTQIRARVEEVRAVVEGADGNSRDTDHLIATDGDFIASPGTKLVIAPKDRIWLPDDDDSDDTLARLSAEIKEATGEDGSIDHQELRI